MRKLIAAISYGLLIMVLAVAVIEISYRVSWKFGKHDPVGFYAMNTFRLRLWSRWLGPKQDLFWPPFQVFANKDLHDIERLKRVLDGTRLPPSQVWHPTDFLLAPSLTPGSTYEVRSNSLGYRDPERTLQKGKGIFRILALGNYATFGHAVSNEDAFVSQLEALLNKEFKPRRFEVWNGGRHTGTAIQGWSRLVLEGDQIKPDLILWEYTFVDKFVWDDNLFLGPLLLPQSGPWGVVRKTMGALLEPVLIHSVVFFKLHRQLNKFAKNRDTRLDEVNRLAVAWAKKRGIPIVFIMRPESKSPNAPKQDADGVYYYSTGQAFKDFPPTREHVARFQSSPNWTDEFTTSIFVLKEAHDPQVYFTDYFQYSKAGHWALARGLMAKLRPILAKAASR